jgi:hypothetical protein
MTLSVTFPPSIDALQKVYSITSSARTRMPWRKPTMLSRLGEKRTFRDFGNPTYVTHTPANYGER